MGLCGHRLGSVVCGLVWALWALVLMVWALRLSDGLWAYLVGSGGLVCGLGLQGL